MGFLRNLKYFSVAVVAFIWAMTLSSCAKNEFEVEFQLPANVNATYKISYCASDAKGSISIETAANIAAGKGSLKCITRNPATVWIFRGNAQLPSAVFFAERGDKIRITGDSDNPAEWQISGGGKANELLGQWRAQNREAIEKAVAAGAPGKGKAAEALNAAVAEFVKKHADSPAAAVVLGAYYNSRVDAGQFRRLCRLLEESGIAEEYPLLMARQDYLGLQTENPKLKDFEVQSFWRNLDTLRLVSAKAPNFVYLWRRNDLHQDELKDSLKNLAKARRDSASLLITDISLDADSAMWAYQVKRDSIKGTLRAIMPKGLADENIIALGIGETPWFVVTKKGKLLYSGSDFESAKQCLEGEL